MFDEIFKVLVIGPEGSGKTSLINQFVQEGQDTNYQYEITTTVELYIHSCPAKFKIKEKENQTVNLHIRDTGSDIKDANSQICAKNTNVVLIAIDLSKSREKNQEYLDSLKSKHPSLFENPNQIKLLVGTKDDHSESETNKKYNYELMQEFVNSNSFFNFYKEPTSARANQNINGVFIHLTQLIVDKINSTQKKERKIRMSYMHLKSREEKASVVNTNNKPIYPTCLDEITDAITLTETNITSLAPDSTELTNFKTSLENLRTQLHKIYLQRLTSKDNYEEINIKDIKEAASQAKIIAQTVSTELKKPREDRTLIPVEIKQAATKMREAFGSVGWRIFAAVVITAVCAIAGGVGGFFLGGVGSIPAATLGTWLGIEITTTLLGVTLTPTAISAAFFTRSIPKTNSYQINQCSKDLEFNAEQVLKNTPTLKT